MGKSVIKCAATVTKYGNSLTLYRMGNLRVLRVDGIHPGSITLNEIDRPYETIRASAVVNSSDGNLYGCLGRIHLQTNGTLQYYCAPTYHAGNAGYSYLGSGDCIVGTLTWIVSQS